MEKFVNLASFDYFCRGHAGCRAEIGEEEFQVVKGCKTRDPFVIELRDNEVNQAEATGELITCSETRKREAEK